MPGGHFGAAEAKLERGPLLLALGRHAEAGGERVDGARTDRRRRRDGLGGRGDGGGWVETLRALVHFYAP